MVVTDSIPQLKHAAFKAQEALKNVPIKEVLQHKRSRAFLPFVAVNQETTIKEFLKVLSDHSFLSAPIYYAQPDGDRIYTGIVSVNDVLNVAVFQQIFDSKEDFDEANFFDYLERVEPREFFKAPVKTLVGASNESANPWLFYSSDNLFELITVFTTGKQHRALVIDEEVLQRSEQSPIPASASVLLISQTDVVSFLQASKNGESTLPAQVIEPLLDVELKALPSLGGAKATMAMLDTHSALHGFRTMYLDNLAGLPVINKQGQVVANLSSSDLRGLTLDKVGNISLPVFEFLETLDRKPDQLMADQVRTIEKTGTMGQAMNSLLKNRIHRLWVTNGNEALAGVVSLTDILRLFVVA
ncbi:hypothetical protein HDV03_005064 [Kappamyces sp. JEL0829]|nr:hypothetical protein HDV03_005064 [Kappamyces sp. JEL0829]